MKKFDEKRPKSFVEMLAKNDGRQNSFKTTTPVLDSSGNESDSSEELLYGPGFVSRLKSRYMSVAIRGSSGIYGNTGSNRKRPALRRTASFEEFLEKEKMRNESAANAIKSSLHCDSKPSVNHLHHRSSNNNNSSSSKCDSRRRESREESFKRCQSVEVLTSADSAKKLSGGRRHLDAVLDSLANDKIIIVDNDDPIPRNGKYQKHRRSVPLLFGVQVRELPAPDTVRETRRLFESGPKPMTSSSGGSQGLTLWNVLAITNSLR